MPTAKLETGKFFHWFRRHRTPRQSCWRTEVETRNSECSTYLIVNLRKITTVSSSGWPTSGERPCLGPWALQDLLAAISEPWPFRFRHGDRNARDPAVHPGPSHGDIVTGGPARTQVGLDRAWCPTVVRAGTRWLWTRLAPDPLARPMGQLAVGRLHSETGVPTTPGARAGTIATQIGRERRLGGVGGTNRSERRVFSRSPTILSGAP